MKDTSTPHKIATNGAVRKGMSSLVKPSRTDVNPKDKSAIDHVKSLSRRLADAQTLADVRLQEIIVLSKLVIDLTQQIQPKTTLLNSKPENAWKRKFWKVPFHFAERASSSLKRDLIALRKCPLFNQSWYLKKYPDVQQSGIDPALHYLKFGAREGRDPGPNFNTLEYLKENSGLINADENPLLHYMKKNG